MADGPTRTAQADAAGAIPIRIAEAAHFARVRAFFAGIEFHDVSICRAFHIQDVSQIGPANWPGLELKVQHAEKGGALAPAECIFSIERGFRAALRLDAFFCPLLMRFDGSRSVEKAYEIARRARELPARFALDTLLDLVATMVERGFLKVHPPRPDKRR